MSDWVERPFILHNANSDSASFEYEFDFSAYEQVDLWCGVTAVGAGNTFNLKWQQREPSFLNDTSTAWADISGKAITEVDTGTSLPSWQTVQLLKTDIKGRLKLVGTLSDTAAVTNRISFLLRG